MAFGGSIKLTGESEYKRALSQINQALRENASQMKAVTSEYDRNDKSQLAVASKTEVLKKRLAEQVEKIELLKSRYDELSGSEDKNSKSMSDLRIQINNTQSEINKTSKELDSLTKEESENTKETNKNKQGWTSWGATLADLRSIAIQKLIEGIKTLVNKMIELGKQAISNYAEFEQLEGGIESLFGGMEKGAEQINKVNSLAANAWSDLTMSQNDYYKSFTSTYALMKGDIADQNEAIEKTQELMTLNSDLANTFGYSMDTASNAVNWALKGTFSYIDNLGIGIKGTKEGFLEAAHNVGYMVKSVDELTSSQILDVLKKTADQFGVLGKTADEAKTTIQGSTKMLQASWSNMLTGLADDNANFEELLNNLVDSVVNTANLLLPRISNVLDGMVDLFMGLADTLLPQLLDIGVQLITKLITGITSNIGNIMSTINSLINTILTTIITLLPQIIEAGVQIIISLIQGLAQSLPQLIPQMVDAILLIVDTLIDNIDLLVDAGIELIIALADGLIEAVPRLIEKAPIIIQKLVDAIIRNVPKLVQAGGKLIGELVSGIIGASMKLIEVAPLLIKTLVSAIKGTIGDIISAGKDLVVGIYQGMFDKVGWLFNKVREMAKGILNNIKSALGIHSPSKVMADVVGKNMALGIGEGFSDEMRDVSKEMQESIPTSFDINNNGNISSSGINSNTGLVASFMEALGNMKIELDDENVGRFVEKTVTNAIYS